MFMVYVITLLKREFIDDAPRTIQQWSSNNPSYRFYVHSNKVFRLKSIENLSYEADQKLDVLKW